MAQRELAQQRMALDAASTAARERMGQADAQSRQAFEVQKTRAVLADRQADRDSKAQMLNAEMAFSAQMGKGV